MANSEKGEIVTWSIVTSIFGDYEVLAPPLVPQRAKLICFTDRPFICEGWEVVPVDPSHKDPRRASRHIKLLIHRYIDGPTIHIDASMILKGDVVALADSCGDFAIPRHTHRSCLYDEINVCIDWGKDDPAKLTAQRQRYLDAGMPRGFGLWECGLIVRRPSLLVEQFCSAWWEEYDSGSCRDQVSLPFTAWRQESRPETIAMSLWKNDVCEVKTRNGKVDHGIRK